MYNTSETIETYVNVPNGLWKESQDFAMRLVSMARLLDRPVCDNFMHNADYKQKRRFLSTITQSAHRRLVGVAWPTGRVSVICSDPVRGEGYNPSSYVWSAVVNRYMTVEIKNTRWMEHRCDIPERYDSRQAFIKEMETVTFPRPWMSYSRRLTEVPGANCTLPNRSRFDYLYSHVLCDDTRKAYLEAWDQQDRKLWLNKSDHLWINSVNHAQIVKIDDERFMVIDPDGVVKTEYRSNSPRYYHSFDSAFRDVNREWHTPLITTKFLETV